MAPETMATGLRKPLDDSPEIIHLHRVGFSGGGWHVGRRVATRLVIRLIFFKPVEPK